MPSTERLRGDGEKDAQKLLHERITSSAERVSGHYRQLRKFWRYYLTNSDRRGWWRRENDRDPGAGVDWRANLFVPATFSVIETAVPRAVFALFGREPYVEVAGRELSDKQNASAVQNMLSYDFEQSKIIQMAVEFFKSFYIFGTAVCRVDYHRDFYYRKLPPEYTFDIQVDENGEIVQAVERKLPDKERVMRYDGPKATLVSLFDFFPDPQFTTIGEMRYVAERVETTISKLKDENKKYREVTGKNLYKNLDEIKKYHESRMVDFANQEDLRQDTEEIMRFNFGYGGQRGDVVSRDDDLVVTYRYWEDDRYVVMANGHTIIKDAENPYSDKRKPYIAAQCFPVLKEFYGLGLVHPIQFLQEELNTLRNIALDQGKLNLYGVWAVEESLTLDDTDMAIFPGKTIPMEFTNGKPNIAQVFQNTLPSDYERLENRVQRDLQSTLAINDYMIGAGAGSAGTASEAAMLNASAANRFRLQALIAQEKWVQELADMFISRRQQFLEEPHTFRVLGEQGYFYPKIGPQDIWGKFDYKAQGSQSQPNKEVLRTQMIQLLSVAAGNPITMSMTNWPEAYKELWSLFDFRFADRFVLSPPNRQLSQKQENYIILQGEKVEVEPNDPHEEHMRDLIGIFDQVLASQDDRVMEAFQHHQEQHQKFLQMGQGGAPKGQQPGQTTGAPGNQPNFENQGPPTLDALQSRVMGGPGGPVA